jgi:hypothetical protein
MAYTERIRGRCLDFHRWEDPRRRAHSQLWTVLNSRSDDALGDIRWSRARREYCFFPATADLMFNSRCLREIVDQLERLNAEQHRRKAAG